MKLIYITTYEIDNDYIMADYGDTPETYANAFINEGLSEDDIEYISKETKILWEE